MSEALRNRSPENDNNYNDDPDVVTLEINSKTQATPTRFTEAASQTEDVEAEFDPKSKDQLDHIRNYVTDLKVSLESAGSQDTFTTNRILSIRKKISDLHELIRYQSEAFANGDESPQIEQRGLKIWAGLQEVLDAYDELSLEDSAEGTEIKTGWWSEEFRTDHKIKSAGIEGDLRQVWGENDSPLGFEPPVVQIEEKDRSGWFDTRFKEDRGFSPVSRDAELTQRGEIITAQAQENHDPLPLKVTAYPLPGGKHRIMMSHQNPERLFPESNKDTLTSEQIEDYREWVEPPAEAVNTVIDTPSSLDVPISSDEVNLSNEDIRQRWLEAKELHELKHQEYNDAARAYYNSLAEQSFFNRNLTRMKASFGFKPKLPPEVEVMREEMFEATANYNDCSRELLLFRDLIGKKNHHDVSDKTLERYNRLLARTLILNTFNTQREIQTQAVEALNFKPGNLTEFFKKNKQAIRLTGAAVVGALSGGVVPAGMWWVRAMVGATAAGAAATYVGNKMDDRVNKIEGRVQVDYETEVNQIEYYLKDNTLKEDELEYIYQRLTDLYRHVDAAMQQKIIAILGTAFGAGLVGGMASGAVMQGFGTDSVIATHEIAQDPSEGSKGSFSQAVMSPEERESVLADAQQKLDEYREQTIAEAKAKVAEGAGLAPSEVTGPDPKEAPVSGFAGAVETTQESSQHTVEAGETMWGYLKEMGFSDTETMKVINGLSEEDLRKIGFGIGSEIDADRLTAGATVNLEELRRLAESISGPSDTPIEAIESKAVSELSHDAASPNPSEAKWPLSSINTTLFESDKSWKGIPFAAEPNNIHEFALNYPNGFNAFEADLNKNFVSKIQGPDPRPGFLASLFGSVPEKSNACQQLAPYTVGEVKDLASLGNEAKCQAFLTEHNIDRKDFDIWHKALSDWEKSGKLRFSYDTQFGDAVRGAFIVQSQVRPLDIT